MKNILLIMSFVLLTNSVLAFELCDKNTSLRDCGQKVPIKAVIGERLKLEKRTNLDITKIGRLKELFEIADSLDEKTINNILKEFPDLMNNYATSVPNPDSATPVLLGGLTNLEGGFIGIGAGILIGILGALTAVIFGWVKYRKLKK